MCGLCNGLVRFVRKRDKNHQFELAPLQSPLAHQVLKPYGKNPDDLDSIYVIANHKQKSEKLLFKSRAALFILNEIGGFWRVLGLFGILPTFLLDFFYGIIARLRYRLFGKIDLDS